MRRLPFLVVVASFVVAAACSAGAPASSPAASSSSSSTPAQAPTPAATASVPAGSVGVVLTHYEALRAALADDRFDVATAAAALLPAAQDLVAKKLAGADDVVRGTTALLDGAKASDLKAARLAFGELSRGVVALVVADPSLQAGRFLFECPMAKGYQRWVQTSAEMKNPYMGKRMLECGSALVAWRVEG